MFFTKRKMKNFVILLLFLIFSINTNMSDKERNSLLQKLTEKISVDISGEIKSKYYSENHLKDTIKYEPEIIDSIMEQYNFPKYFNFFEDTGATINVKDQAKCGCCWSHAATTALAYRYHKIGIEVDLSPQHALSCYIRDCDAGNYLIDSQMNLVKNGTVTEGCLPFSSADGIIVDDCPTSCKDGSEFKKYYSKNAYMTQDYYSKETFYEIVTLILDQLNNYGPVVTGIDVYYDFMELHEDPERCHNEVYTYNEKSLYLGGHAVTIVGYGYMDSKYYWLIQNSWGEYACDKGFVKVEFGQIGVESVAFAEPNIKKDWEKPIGIPIKFESLDGYCNMNISSTDLTEYWINTLDIDFKNTETEKPFNYQCSIVSLINGKKKVCYYEHYNYYNDKGTFKFDFSQSLGDDNYFILDSSFKEKEFNFYGIDAYDYVFSNYLYVSQEGSKIMFFYSNFGGDDRFISPIFPNENSTYSLSDCKNVNFVDFDFVYCDIKQNELDYFYDMNKQGSSLVYNVLCGYKQEVSTIVYKLDTNKYPIFKVKKFVLPQEKILSSQSKFTGVADIEGSISGYHSTQSSFYLFAYIEIENQNYTSLIQCVLNKPRRIMKNYLFNCYSLSEIPEIPYNNVYFHPYNMPDQIQYPYEIYMKEIIKGEKYDPTIFVPKIQVYIESLCPDCINFITKSFKDFYEKVKKPNLAEIEFIPFGNGKEVYNISTKKYDFSCQHGDNECYGNLIETCAIQILGRVQSYSTIICIESNIEKYENNFDKTLEFCLSIDQTTIQEIKDCVVSDMGNIYEHQMAQKTDINHKWVPWIVVDGYHDVNIENEIIDSLIDYICGDDKSKCY